MKMEGMKQKAGRKKKGELGEKLNTDEAIAKEMGITVSKFNRMLRMSEATKDVCSKVDDGTLALSIASALSFLKPKIRIWRYAFPTSAIGSRRSVWNTSSAWRKRTG